VDSVIIVGYSLVRKQKAGSGEEPAHKKNLMEIQPKFLCRNSFCQNAPAWCRNSSNTSEVRPAFDFADA
jgi:hypothetical protein